MQNAERLHLLDTFSHFGPRELTLLSECLSPCSFEAGGLVFNEGDAPGDFFLLEDGDIRVRRMTAFGSFELFIPRSGDLFGEDGFLTAATREGDAEILEDANVVVFDAPKVAGAIADDARLELALHWALWKSLSRKLRLSNDRLIRIFASDSQMPHLTKPAHDRPTSASDMNMGHKVDLFREQRLSPMEINFLASLSREEHFEPGQPIFREGETGDKMYVVAEGTVMISKNIPGIGEEALAFLERGEYFGEMALIDHRSRSADARAHPDEAVTVLALPRSVVEGLLDIDKVSSVRLLSILTSLAAKRIRELEEKLVGWFLLAGGDIDPSLELP